MAPTKLWTLATVVCACLKVAAMPMGMAEESPTIDPHPSTRSNSRNLNQEPFRHRDNPMFQSAAIYVQREQASRSGQPPTLNGGPVAGEARGPADQASIAGPTPAAGFDGFVELIIEDPRTSERCCQWRCFTDGWRDVAARTQAVDPVDCALEPHLSPNWPWVRCQANGPGVHGLPDYFTWYCAATGGESVLIWPYEQGGMGSKAVQDDRAWARK